MATFKKLFVVFLMVAFTAGCATKSDNIKADHISPLAYQIYNCEQIGQEMSRVSQEVSEMAARQDSTSTKDKVAIGVGVVFWPALFLVAAGKDNEKEIARLKGEADALEQVAITKKCTGVIAQRDAAVESWKKGQQKKNETGDALVEAKYQEQDDFPIVSYDFDAKSGKGTLVVDIRGKGMNARHRVVNNIGKICSDKNVTLISGEETRKGGRYRVLDESVKDGLLTISFEASW